jgi:8-oxo-dGTP diphosphatase
VLDVLQAPSDSHEHRHIGRKRRLEYTTLATVFCGEKFTIGELRRVYEVVWGSPLDPRNFNRKVLHTEGFVKPTGETRSQETGRPAALYTHGDATSLYPPMFRAVPSDDGRRLQRR